MATTRISVDLRHAVPADDYDEISREVHSFVWGYLQNKYLDNSTNPVQLSLHQHDADGQACPACVQLATDGKS
jgi:hypothetical protein